jgi:hypothetical protein
VTLGGSQLGAGQRVLAYDDAMASAWRDGRWPGL